MCYGIIQKLMICELDSGAARVFRLELVLTSSKSLWKLCCSFLPLSSLSECAFSSHPLSWNNIFLKVCWRSNVGSEEAWKSVERWGKDVRNLSGLPQPIKSLIHNLHTLPVAFPDPLKGFEANYFWEEAERLWFGKCGKGMGEGRVFLLSSTA